MKRYSLLLGAALLTAVFEVGAVACDDDEDTGGTDEATATQPAGGDEPTATDEDSGATGDVIDVTIAGVGANTVAGSATITPGEPVVVEVTIDSGLEPGSHIAYIHMGTCAAPGGVQAGLTDITADSSGAGSSSTTLDAAVLIADLQDGNHHIEVHDLAGAAAAACGDIPTAG